MVVRPSLEADPGRHTALPASQSVRTHPELKLTNLSSLRSLGSLLLLIQLLDGLDLLLQLHPPANIVDYEAAAMLELFTVTSVTTSDSLISIFLIIWIKIKCFSL